MEIMIDNTKIIEFLKMIYDYCMKYHWDIFKLQKLEKELNLTNIPYSISELGKMYLEYCNMNEISLKILNNIIKEMENNTLESKNKPNPILKEYGIITYNIWNNEIEKEIFLRELYNYCQSVQYRTRELELLAMYLGISSLKIKNYAKEYAINYLGMTAEEYYEHKMAINNEKTKENALKRNGSKIIYDKLLLAKSEEEIIKILEESTYTIKYLKIGISNYILIYGKKSDEEILKEKFRIYDNYKKESKLKQKAKEQEQLQKSKLEKARFYIKKYIESNNYSVDYYCKQINLDKSTFKEYLDIIKQYDQELYLKYEQKIKEDRQSRYELLTTKINLIINYINNGIDDNGIIRPFDIVDYFIISSIYSKEILKLAESILSKHDYIKLKKFLNDNKQALKETPNIINNILEERVEYNIKCDEYGKPIQGTGEVFSNESKLKLIKYLIDNNIPINRITYNILYRRYRLGIIDIDKLSKSKKRK